MNIISIVGSTAVGKTGAALTIAKQLLKEKKVSAVDIISADSRQVYQGLSILSGADIPADSRQFDAINSSTFPYFQLLGHQIYLHGVSIIRPTAEWSLAHFHQLAERVIANASAEKRAVFVVGGTGLYQTQLLHVDSLDFSPPLPQVREKAQEMNVGQLQSWLDELDSTALMILNQSDRANPRRLIRAIERVLSKQSYGTDGPKKAPLESGMSSHEQSFYGLYTNKLELEKRIRERVAERLDHGAVAEVEALVAELEELRIPLSKLPAHTTCGLREVQAFINGEVDRPQCLELWSRRELAYAKRQETWWKKYPDVRWFDIDEAGTQIDLLFAVQQHFS